MPFAFCLLPLLSRVISRKDPPNLLGESIHRPLPRNLIPPKDWRDRQRNRLRRAEPVIAGFICEMGAADQQVAERLCHLAARAVAKLAHRVWQAVGDSSTAAVGHDLAPDERPPRSMEFRQM